MSELIENEVVNVEKSAVKEIEGAPKEAQIREHISEQEALIGDLTLQLGKAFYDRYGQSPGPEFAELVRGIDAARFAIRVYQTQLGKLRGVAICQNCSLEMPYDFVFCGRCGVTLEKPEFPPVQPEPVFAPVDVPQTNRCLHCGNELAPGARFCVSCGNKV